MEGTSSQRGWKLPFRALGYYFSGTEMVHCKTRTLLSNFVTANSDRFKSIVMSDDVMNHVQKMQHLSVWGTHVELHPCSKFSLYAQTPEEVNLALLLPNMGLIKKS